LGTTFSFFDVSQVDVVELKKKIGYQSGDPQDRPVISVPNDSAEYNIVLQSLVEAKADFNTHEWVEFTKEETEEAPYYELKLAYPFQSQDKFWAADFGVEYEYSCQKCRKPSSIIRQLSPMKLDLKKTGKWQMFFVPPAIIVREDVKQIIEAAGLTGARFSKVVDYKNRDIESVYYQMQVDHILPPMNAYTIKSNGGYLPCEACGRNVTHLETPISYALKDFRDAKDFNLSQEHIFNFDMRVLVISNRARNIIKKAVRRCNPVPVLFIDYMTNLSEKL